MHCQGSPFIAFAKQVIVALALAAAMALLTSCGSGTASPPMATLKITTSTMFYPAFDPNISDYVATAPSGSPLQVSVDAPPGTQVSLDGQPFRTLAFTTSVPITPGQSFSLVVNSSGSSKTYWVRG